MGKEPRGRDGALAAVVDTACQHGLAPECGERLRRLVLDKYPKAFQRALCGGPPAQVELMIAHPKPVAGILRAGPRAFRSRQDVRLAEHFTQLEAARAVSRNP